MLNKPIVIEIDKPLDLPIHSVQFDKNSRFIDVYLLNNSLPLDVTRYTVTVAGIKPDGQSFFNECSKVTPHEGLVRFEVTEQMNVTTGIVKCELKIYNDSEGVLTTKPFDIKVTRSLLTSDIESTSEFQALTEAVSKVQEFDNINREVKLARGTYNTLNDRLDNVDEIQAQTNVQLSELEQDVSRIANMVDKFGAVGDGVADDTDAIQKAFDHGGVILFSKDKVYKFTRELLINKSNTNILGNDATLKFEGDGIDGALLSISGRNADDYCENIKISGITIDATAQKYKGGSESDWTATSPRPKYKGVRGLEISFCKNAVIEKNILNDIYGDGITVKRSTDVVVDNNNLYDCSGGNIVIDPNLVYDCFGDGIVSFFSYNVTISNNTIINKRKYKVDETSNTLNTSVLNLPCGRSGLEFEYAINQDGKDDDPNFNAPGYKEFLTRDGFGLLMFNNYVYGYTKGVHLESHVKCNIDSNKIIYCHVGILHSGGQETQITNNYICNENLVKAPQIGYDKYSGGIALTEYGTPKLTTVKGNVIYLNNPNGNNLHGISIGRTNAHILHNRIVAKYCIYENLNKPCDSNSIVIKDNDLYSYLDGNFIYKYYNTSEWKIIGNNFTCAGNGETSSLKLSNNVSNIENTGRVIISDNTFRNAIIEFVGYGGSNNLISCNTFEYDGKMKYQSYAISFGSTRYLTIENNYFNVDSTRIQ